MKTIRGLTCLLFLLAARSAFGEAVELNGITSLFGENMAFLVMHQAGQPRPDSFALTEGQSHAGVKVLAVDPLRHQVQIEQNGQSQLLRLGFASDLDVWCTPAPDLSVSPVLSPFTSEQRAQLDHFLNHDDAAQKIRAGHGDVNTANLPPLVPGADNASAASGASSASSTASPGTPSANLLGAAAGAATAADSLGAGLNSASSSAPDYTRDYWYKTSMAIEQNRLATAAQVADGNLEPLPRTPLTPTGTPPGLIGSETYFSSHIPGFMPGGSVDN